MFLRMFWSILADATAAVQQSEPLSIWTLVFSGIAALGGILGATGGIFSAVYTTTSARKKADRELLASKLEKLFAELKDEITQTMKGVEVVDNEIKKGTPVATIYEDNVQIFRPIWSEANYSEILVTLYFEDLMHTFSVFRDHRSKIGIALKNLSTAPFPGMADVLLKAELNKMTDAYNVLRLELSAIAKRICPRK